MSSMQRWRILIVAVATTVLSASTIASSVSAAPAKRKTIPSLPKFLGLNKKSTPTDDDEEATKKEDADVVADTNDTTKPSEEKEAGDRDDVAGSDEPKSITTDDKEKSDEPSSQTNKTLHAIYIAPPMQQQHVRPMPYPYAIPHQQHQSSPSTTRNKPPSILSAILSALFFPRPQPSPYPPIPGMPPTSPPVPIGINPIKLMRLAMMILPFLGLGGHSDAFLPSPSQHYTFERVNHRYRRDGYALRQALESPPPGVKKHRWKRIFGRRKREVVSNLIMEENTSSQIPSLANGALYNRTVIIVDMKPDSRVGNGMADQLRDTVSFLLEQHRDHVDKQRHHVAHMQQPSNLFGLPSKLLPSYFSTSLTNHRTHRGIRPALGELEVVLFLDSPGGTVSDYGLAASQLARLRNEEGVTLSVCVDRVAASGGYMMACQATPGHLYAAPFAMLGSIGVIMETVNVNEVLRKYGVKPLVIKAGKSKAPLKSLGEVTDEELQMVQDDANVIHEAFKKWVTESRPNVVASKEWIDKVCTGSVFLGNEARELGLVDRVLTSDEYVAERIAAGDRVLRLIPYKGQFVLNISPLDLLAAGMDAEGRAKICQRISGIRRGFIQYVAPLFRVGAAVSILNHLASLQSGGYSWSA